MAVEEIAKHKETEGVTAHVIWMTTGLSCGSARSARTTSSLSSGDWSE